MIAINDCKTKESFNFDPKLIGLFLITKAKRGKKKKKMLRFFLFFKERIYQYLALIDDIGYNI